jgi:hypothetical protein
MRTFNKDIPAERTAGICIGYPFKGAFSGCQWPWNGRHTEATAWKKEAQLVHGNIY